MVIAYIKREIGDKKVSAALANARRKGGNALEEYIISNGVIITAGNYLNFWRKYKGFDYEVAMLGEPNTAAEKAAQAIHEHNVSYITSSETCPEDMCEERTSWSDMEDYADGLEGALLAIIDYLCDNAE